MGKGSFTVHCTAIIGISILGLSICGCDGGPRLVPVSGSITVDGQPAEGAILIFHPSDPSTQMLATGSTRSDGRFDLVSNTKPGIVPGTYKVTVVWPDPKIKPTDAQRMTGMFEEGPDLLKGRYETPAKSVLSVEITEASDVLPPFVLRSS
jgi:hypothetical protein